MSTNNFITNDDFMISSYLHTPEDPKVIDNKKDKDAQYWATTANRVIITPTETLEELEDQWINFNSMIKKHRRESDWESLSLYGMTNKDHYEKLRAKFLRQDIDNEIDNIQQQISSSDIPVTESYVDMADTYYTPDAINYTSADVDKARLWAQESDRVIILPTRTLQELEELWDAYNAMIKKHRRESDWYSFEVFGISNLTHYEYLKNEFLREDIRQEDQERYGSVIESVTVADKKRYYNKAIKESRIDTAKALIESVATNDNIFDSSITQNVVSDVLDKYDADLIAPSDIVDNITCGDMPFFSPEEIIDMGVFSSNPEDNFYGVIADNTHIDDNISVQEWFNVYRAADKGLYTELCNYTNLWVDKVRGLMHELSLINPINEVQIKSKKQSILELGWNPEIPFDTKSRLLAREMSVFRQKSNFSGSKYRMVDLREYKVGDTFALTEGNNDNNLRPVYVVMIEGKSYFSKAIKVLTKDIYSHIAISLDPELHEMYSYGIQTNERSSHKGFRREDIVDLPVGGRLGVFVFFISDKVYHRIEEFIDTFKENIEKTSYSFINLITYLFNIPYNTEWSLVCSQFVDRCLQSVGINLTGKDSSQVAPSDMNKALTNENRIYNVYEGLASKYKANEIKKLVNALSKKAIPLKEAYARFYENSKRFIMGVISNINDISALNEMRNYLDTVKDTKTRNLLERLVFDPIDIRPLGEAKEFPIQFDKEGNLLIKNLKKLDYEGEYAKSHKLLQQYDKTSNYEGMKYELSKLWMMLCMIEETLHSKKFQELPSFAIETSSAHKARAKIINDFQYYLTKVMNNEPKFNFTEYYENSPFSSAVTKINNSTLVFMGKMIKKFIKSI